MKERAQNEALPQSPVNRPFLEATLSVVAVVAWFAASTEAINFVLERYS